MSSPYLCPNCKTNRTRFNIIEQLAKPVKLNPQTGDIVEELQQSNLDPFHVSYKGPNYRVQCGTCGLIEDEISFVKRAQINQSY
ncbi:MULTISPECIES: DNA alkylation repair protein [Metabacillus]|uniref:DNA alkylation repair protein n=1 Tax=Metabacillus endolithicus TaxID=1535204 RepID=A0ABW5BXI9_9BACI|nr:MULTISPECIES: DNA alkylation repair protein [Metabacillus]MCM3162979.1 DNA alkylation repair protein [Metabacillus litoralis]MCM3410685.1 DNA alkylation repair protein [Metabacillus litoralis]UHA58227.1 DNA alkylation repair protein [Metabacillus litoralis]UPG64212.1 DNA alkylation repair protein [Metabacillus endolithicus]